MGRKQKHNRLTIEQGGVSALFTMKYDGSMVMQMNGAMEISGPTLTDLAEMFSVAAEHQQEHRVLSEQIREAGRKARLAEETPEEPIPPAPPEF